MTRFFSNILLLLIGWVRYPIRWWVKTKITPEDVGQSLTLDPERPLCYVLRTGSLADWFVLERACLELDLPTPQLAHYQLPSVGRPVVLSLPAPRVSPPSEIDRLIEDALRENRMDIQIVPVSLFWGRDPGKETSLFRVLFSHAENPGVLRKFLIMLANGRNTLMHFGRPLELAAVMEGGLEAKDAARKLKRVLRIHFRRQRSAALGPSLSHRSKVILQVLSLPGVRDAIEAESRNEDIPLTEARGRAREYAEEIAADYSDTTIRFLSLIMTRLFNRVFEKIEVYHAEKLRETAQDNGVLYLPAHRSYFDFLLVSYILYHRGLIPPHIASGINLNFWPVGGLLRKGGAFYLRRSFGGNQLYTAVFRAYVDVLLSRGYSMKFYPEGGRSRTGRLLQPKTGMLSMVTQSFLRNPEQPVVIVPVFIGYDRVPEVNTYFKFLRGGKSAAERDESIFELLRGAANVVKRSYGNAYLSFGQPIALRAFADRRQADWREAAGQLQNDIRPEWLSDFVNDLADEVMTGINNAAALNAIGIVSALLLSTPQKSMAEDELVSRIDVCLRLLRAQPYHSETVVPEADGKQLLERAETVARLSRSEHAWGDIILAEGKDAVLLTYCRNNVLHLFAIPSLVAAVFANDKSLNRKDLMRRCLDLYPFFKSELFLPWDSEGAEGVIKGMTELFVSEGLLVQGNGEVLTQAAPGTNAFAHLAGLGRIMRETLERYCVTTLLLRENMGRGYVERDAFEEECQLMAQRMAMLTGRNAPEFFDKGLFRDYIDTLKSLDLLREDCDQGEQECERLVIDNRLQQRAEDALALLSPDIRQVILQLLHRPRDTETADPSEADAASHKAA